MTDEVRECIVIQIFKSPPPGVTFRRYARKVSFAALFEGTNTAARDPDTALGAVARSQTPSEGGRESWGSGGGSNTCTSLHTRGF